MKRPKTLPAFTDEQVKKFHALLATKVTYMMGRKLEEGDWAEVYCNAKNIPLQTWSNLQIDIMHDNLGLEHKMLCYRSRVNLIDACGQTLMHPSATRSIRIPQDISDPNEAMEVLLNQYADLIESRRLKVLENSQKKNADMRTGWILWQESLRQFLYFEEEMLPPNPDDYKAKWVESGGGTRKGSKNLWIYEKETGKKRYSITTVAGAKIQPYFDVPPPSDPNLYLFTVIGEAIDNGLIKIWLTENTFKELKKITHGVVETEKISELILHSVNKISKEEVNNKIDSNISVALIITKAAYEALRNSLPGVNDEHSFQLLIKYLQNN
jgi:hypothetical protein